jgi:hypothetical protein
MPAENVTITATWTINKYIVTFVDHDGTVIDIQTVEHGGSATAPAANPEREGYTFTGWDVAFNNVTENLTVKAQYEIKTYTVSFVDTNAVDLTEATIEVWNSNNELIADLTKVANGAYSYKISLDGYVPLTGSFTIADADKEVELTLLAAVAVIGDTYYADLVTALDNATSGTTVVLLKNHTLSRDATVKPGVTLLLPFNSEHSSELNNYENGTSQKVDRGSAFVELTIPANVNLEVAGTLTVNAKRGNSSTKYMGHVTGANYAQLQLQEDSKLTIHSNGTLNVLGFIYGTGSIEALQGSNILESMFIKGFRGGTATLSVASQVFPFDQYTVNNIEVDMTINKGAKYTGSVLIYASSSYTAGTANLIGPEKGYLLELSDGKIVKRFNPSNGRVSFEIIGTANLNNTSFKAGGVTANSNNKDLPFDGGWSITVSEGSNVVVNSWVMLLPGASLYIQSGAEVTVSENGKITVFDPYEHIDTYNAYPNTDAKSYYRIQPTFDYDSETPALLQVDGILTVNGSIAGRVHKGDAGLISLSDSAIKPYEIKYVHGSASSAKYTQEMSSI